VVSLAEGASVAKIIPRLNKRLLKKGEKQE
jgi:hypothetical protein